MTVQDTHLKSRALRAIALQEQGCFVLDYRRELPLPEVTDLHYSRAIDTSGQRFDYETEWGKFHFDREERSLLVLAQGTPPHAAVTSMSRLALVTATMHTDSVIVHNNGSSFEMDFKHNGRADWSTLQALNETLKAEQLPVAVWQLDEAEKVHPSVIRITNESAMLFASSAIWDNDEQNLVAAQVVTTSQDLLKAIKATLANNSGKNYLTVKSPDGDAFLKGARRGYITVGNSLIGANADGTVTTLLHPLSGDPQANPANHFYVVVAHGEKLSQKFAERLDLAIPWPIQPEWANYLLEAGQEEGLVQVLPSSGNDFEAGLRVDKNESRWHQIISDGLKSASITI